MTEPSLWISRLLKKTFPVLWLLFRLENPVGEAQIAAILEIDLETARNHLRSLVGLGFAARLARVNGYKITPLGREVFAPPNAGIPRIDIPTTTATEIKVDSVEVVAADLPTTTAEKPRKARNASNRNRFRKPKAARNANPHLRAGTSGIAGASKAEENQAAFREEGVGINPRVQVLCQKEHVSPEFIHAQASRLRDEKRFASNLLIYVVERNDPLPADRSEAERKKYVDNPYSDFLAH